MRLLDCFCGKGGASDGFNRLGFDCTGIDIIDVGYPYRFIKADMRDLRGEDYRGYDVIWGSPPCREFSPCAEFARARERKGLKYQWRKPPNLDEGLELVRCFFKFVHDAKPKIWIMENVPNLAKYTFLSRPVIHKARIARKMKRSFWGNFPPFLMPIDVKKKTVYKIQNVDRSWERAKIPLACSLAFARACKEKLLELPFTENI